MCSGTGRRARPRSLEGIAGARANGKKMAGVECEVLLGLDRHFGAWKALSNWQSESCRADRVKALQKDSVAGQIVRSSGLKGAVAGREDNKKKMAGHNLVIYHLRELPEAQRGCVVPWVTRRVCVSHKA